MPDDFLSTQHPGTAPRRTRSFGRLGLALLAALVLGGGVLGWLVWRGDVQLGLGKETPARLAAPAPSTTPLLPLASSPAPAASAVAQPDLPPEAEALGTRLALLEQRLAQLDLRAEAAAGNATRAEGLLIAFAVRRTLERGQPLGDLEGQLRLRFAGAQPAAVGKVIELARQPVTLDGLIGELDRLTPKLSGEPEGEGGWDRIKREIGGLFTIHSEEASAIDPAAQIARAKLLLRTGQTAKARELISRLPGNAAARDWLGAATRYESAQAALDLLEVAALKEPRELKDGAGKKVEQAGPVGL